MKERLVLFDLDSTLVRIEGLDYLSESKGPEIEMRVKSTTERAMRGDMSFSEAMDEKMELIRPSQEDIAHLAEVYKNSLTDDAREVVHALRRSGRQVGILTGNFRQVVEPLAAMLGINPDNIHANELVFDEHGHYQGHKDSPLWQSDGKAQVVQALRPKYKRITMVGDGAGDLETKPFVDRFIGFGGVKERPIVQQQADVFISSPTLAPVLLDALPAWRRGLRRIRRDPLIRKARGATVIRR